MRDWPDPRLPETPVSIAEAISVGAMAIVPLVQAIYGLLHPLLT